MLQQKFSKFQSKKVTKKIFSLKIDRMKLKKLLITSTKRTNRAKNANRAF